MISIDSADRILVVAPHPDDESLATGGLLQMAFAAGAQVRVVFVTDGDNNPWAQRWVERRWRISDRDRDRWGTRRRAEALAALLCLGGGAVNAHFLGLPDQGLTSLLMRGEDVVVRMLAGEIASFRPTLLFGPAAEDAHPDHSALHVLMSFALASSGAAGLRRFDYVVHRPKAAVTRTPCALALSPALTAQKAAAISCHQTQLAWNPKRFLAFASAEEGYFVPVPPEAHAGHHPICDGELDGTSLRLTAPLPRWRDERVLIALQCPVRGAVRWSLNLPRYSALVPLHDERKSKILKTVEVRREATHLMIDIPVVYLRSLTGVFVKLSRKQWFFDDAGWRELPVNGSIESGNRPRFDWWSRSPTVAAPRKQDHLEIGVA